MRFWKLLIVFVFCLIGLTACTYERGLILFNVQPITRENALQDQKVFNEGQRVYYLFIAPKKMKNEFIRVQIFKMTDKAPWGGNEVVRTKDYRLMKDERYYQTNYFTLYENFKQKTSKYVNGEFVRTNEKIPKVWKLVKFYSNYDVKNIIVSDSDGEHPMFEPDGSINGEKVSSSNTWYNNGGYIRDNYIFKLIFK